MLLNSFSLSLTMGINKLERLFLALFWLDYYYDVASRAPYGALLDGFGNLLKY
jgi:hypothetical protein